jgi:cytochrome P450
MSVEDRYVEDKQLPTPPQAIAAMLDGSVQNPYPIYHYLRELDEGVHWAEPLDGWLCTRYHDIRRIYNDDDTFSARWWDKEGDIDHGGESVPSVAAEADRRYMSIFTQQFMLNDPPEHTEIRSILRNLFTRRGVERWRSVVAAVTDEVLESLDPSADIDIMTEFAQRVPIAVIATMLGVPREDRSRFREWTSAFVDTFDPQIQGEQREACVRTTLELFDYLADRVAERRARPADDLITVMATARLGDGSVLDTSRAVAQLMLLLAAGNDTTANLIGSGITLLIENPLIRLKLVERPHLMPVAIEEMLRLDPPFHFMHRKVVRPITIGGRHLLPGQLCWQLLPAANRDHRAFVNPNVFSLTPRNNVHLAFIHGIHFCLGASLARMEGQVVFTQLLQRYPRFTGGAQQPVRRTDTVIARGFRSRPVRLAPS